MEIYSRRNGFQDEIVMEPEQIGDEIRDELELMNHSNLNIIKLYIQGGIITGNISGMKTMNHSMDRLCSDTGALREILYEISCTLTEIPEFLLLQDSVSLDPEHIFFKRKEGHISLCLLYIPGQKGNIKEQMTALMEYLLQHIDHKKDSAVRLVYGLYHVVRQENYALEDVMEFLREDAATSGEGAGVFRTAGGTEDTNTPGSKEGRQSVENEETFTGSEYAQGMGNTYTSGRMENNLSMGHEGVVSGQEDRYISPESIPDTENSAKHSVRYHEKNHDDYTKEAYKRLRFYRLKSREICYATALAVMLIITASVFTGVLQISASGRLVILAGTFIAFAVTAANTVKLIIFRNSTSEATGDFPPG